MAWFSPLESPVGDFTPIASATTDPPRTHAFTGMTSGLPGPRLCAHSSKSIHALQALFKGTKKLGLLCRQCRITSP